MKQLGNNTFVNLVLALCLLFIAFGCKESDTDSSPAATETIEHADLLREFSDNQVSANAKYKGKRLRIVGAVDFVFVEKGKPVARMSVPYWSNLQLMCEFPESQSDAAATIQKGQRIVVEGTCRGVSDFGRLTLDDCVLK